MKQHEEKTRNKKNTFDEEAEYGTGRWQESKLAQKQTQKSYCGRRNGDWRYSGSNLK
jgi:hypothetical protein